MIEIPYHVSTDGYSCSPGVNPNIVTMVPGGPPRFEKDLSHMWFSFNATFELRGWQYKDMCRRYELYLRNMTPLKVNLISRMQIRPHKCWVQPNTWQLEQTNGLDYFKVSMMLAGFEI